jgi:hypothetical protein
MMRLRSPALNVLHYLRMSEVLCANLATGSSEPSYTEHSHGCSQEVQ